MAEECDYIFARASQFEADFPPAKYTSTGGFHGLRAATTFLRGSDDMNGLRVAVQGVGQTGADLVAQLTARGAHVVATDVNEEALARMVTDFGVTTVAPAEIYSQDVDIFVPCAMGGILNDTTLPQLKCKAIVGLANNQLETPEHGQKLLDMGIAYAPDFIVNGGGIAACAMPIFTTFDKEVGLRRVESIYDVTLDLLQRSQSEGIPTEVLAEQIAMDRIANA